MKQWHRVSAAPATHHVVADVQIHVDGLARGGGCAEQDASGGKVQAIRQAHGGAAHHWLARVFGRDEDRFVDGNTNGQAVDVEQREAGGILPRERARCTTRVNHGVATLQGPSHAPEAAEKGAAGSAAGWATAAEGWAATATAAAGWAATAMVEEGWAVAVMEEEGSEAAAGWAEEAATGSEEAVAMGWEAGWAAGATAAEGWAAAATAAEGWAAGWAAR